MKICPYCGTQLTDETRFCASCGQQQPVVQPNYANVNVNVASAPVSRESTWDGGVLDTVVNSIVASLIMSITCGFGTPWAVCYMMRFIAEHAVIDGKRLKFDGNGGELFGQWIKWFLLTMITCGIYGFWVVPRMYKWICSHIHTD